MDRRMVGLHSLSGPGGEEKISHPSPGLEPSIIQPVVQHYTTIPGSEVDYISFVNISNFHAL
jgi:hypothetical protein